MPEAYFSNYNPPLEGSLADAQWSPSVVVDPIQPAQVTIGIGSAVPLRRQTEILSAIKLLANGIRERNLLEEQFRGVSMITAVSIDNITTSNRRTASTAATANVTNSDVFISMGETATAHSHVVMLDTAFDVLTDVLLENMKNQQN